MHRRISSSRISSALLCLFLNLLLWSCSGDGSPGHSGPAKWVLANVHAADYPTAEALQSLATAVEADPTLGSRYRIDLQLGGVLGNEKDVLEKVQFGAVQLYAGSVAPLAEFSEAIGVLTQPYLFRDAKHYWSVLDGPIGEELLASIAPNGFVGLAWYDAGARSFYNRQRPVESLDDLAGLKIRVQRSEMMRRTVEALGANPVALGFNEVYTSLHTGNIDGAENNLPSYFSERHFEVARFYSLDGHTRVPDLLLVGKQTWESLDPEAQNALRNLARLSSQTQRERWSAFETRVRNELEAAGVEINAIEDLAAFRQAVASADLTSPQHRPWVERIRQVP